MRVLSYDQLRTEKGLPYSRQWLSDLERAGQFPRRVQLGGGKVGRGGKIGWLEHEIDEYLLNLPRGSSMGRPAWLGPKGDKAATAAPVAPAVAPQTCAYPGCESEVAERTGARGPSPKYCERHAQRRKRREPADRGAA